MVSRTHAGLKCAPDAGFRAIRAPPAGRLRHAWRPDTGWASAPAAATMPPMQTGTIHIRLNGEKASVPAAATITELLALQGLAGRRVAVEVNGEIVPRGRHEAHPLHEGDRVEIVHALGGG